MAINHFFDDQTISNSFSGEGIGWQKQERLKDGYFKQTIVKKNVWIKMIYVVMAAYNRKELTIEIDRTINKQRISEKIQLVLVDDSSTDGTADAVKEVCPNVTILT